MVLEGQGREVCDLSGAYEIRLLLMETPSPTREAIIEAGEAIMATASNCALITIGPDGVPQARMMNPFPSEKGLIVWMATDRNTRKVTEMYADPRVTLIYFDQTDPGYATLVGKVRFVDDLVEKEARWKPEWSIYYPGGQYGESYLLIEFTPRRLEVVSLRFDIAADPLAWKAAVVEFDG